MALTSTSVKLVDPRDLLEMLRQHPLTAPFSLALYSEQHGRKGLLEAIRTVCSPLEGDNLCTSECQRGWQESVAQALLANHPVVHSCEQGFLCFIIPLPGNKCLPDCLIGGGVFERNVTNHAAEEPEPAANSELTIKPAHQPLLISRSEAESIAEEVFRTLPRLLDQQVHTLSLTRTTQRLEAVQKLTRDLANCEESEEAVAVVSEALVVLFNLPKVLIVLQQPGRSMTIHSTLGLDPEAFQLDQKRLADYFTKSSGHPEVLPGEELAAFLPGLEIRSGYLFPLTESNSQLGAIAILDVDLHSRDQALIELLVNSLATRLESLKSAEGHRLERQSSSRLVSMISALAQINNRHELYQQILEMASELLTATSGSLMLLNETDGTLKISAAKGMTSSLAKTMSVAFGEGISGRVAKSGFPMLVNDIESDNFGVVAATNRGVCTWTGWTLIQGNIDEWD